MDFDEAISSHAQWKRKLRRYLSKRAGLLPADISLDHKSELGQGIYGEGARYASLPEFARLKHEHAHFHLAASEIARKANSGEDVAQEVEPCANSEFSIASSAVVIALRALKRRIS